MHLHRHDELGSTNDEAIRLAREGAPHGTIVTARQQRSGRGRQGRRWISPPGNLHASFLLRPNAAPGRAAEIGFVAAAALVATLDALAVQATLKWPNDVLVEGAKVAGILTEMSDDAVIVGVGVNVAHAPPDLPYAVTSLSARGVSASVSAVLDRLAGEMARNFALWSDEGFAPIRLAWLLRGPAPGQPMKARVGAEIIDGAFADLALDGALVMQTADGLRRVIAGETS